MSSSSRIKRGFDTIFYNYLNVTRIPIQFWFHLRWNENEITFFPGIILEEIFEDFCFWLLSTEPEKKTVFIPSVCFVVDIKDEANAPLKEVVHDMSATDDVNKVYVHVIYETDVTTSTLCLKKEHWTQCTTGNSLVNQCCLIVREACCNIQYSHKLIYIYHLWLCLLQNVLRVIVYSFAQNENWNCCLQKWCTVYSNFTIYNIVHRRWKHYKTICDPWGTHIFISWSFADDLLRLTIS